MNRSSQTRPDQKRGDKHASKTDKQTETESGRHRVRDRQTHRDRQRQTQTDRDRQDRTDRQTDRQTGRQTSRQTDERIRNDQTKPDLT